MHRTSVPTIACACLLLGTSTLACAQELRLDARTVVEVTDRGSLTDLRLIDGGTRAVVAGSRGVFLVDLASESVLEGGFRTEGPNVVAHLVDVDSDGTFESYRASDVERGMFHLRAASGELLWESTHGLFGDEPFDLDGDGRAEFLLAKPLAGEVRLVDAAGKVLWTRHWHPRSGRAVQLDVDGDGPREILWVGSGQLNVVGADGELRFTKSIEGGHRIVSLDVLSELAPVGPARLFIGVEVGPRDAARHWYVGLGADARKQVGRCRGPRLAPFLDAQRVARGDGALWIKAVNQMQQAPLAGFDDSNLRIVAHDEEGERLGGRTIPTPRGDYAVGDVNGMAVLDTEPLRFLVPYHHRVWELREVLD